MNNEELFMCGNLSRLYGKDWNDLNHEERLSYLRCVKAIISASEIGRTK